MATFPLTASYWVDAQKVYLDFSIPGKILFVCFPCLSPIPGLIWFGSVYLVTTAGFVADQLM